MRIGGLVGVAMLCCALLLGACGAGSGRQGTDLVVTGVGEAVPSGVSAVYQMTVANVGPNAAGAVTIVNSVGPQQSLVSITCSASGGATCPDAPTVSMTVASMPSGGRLDFEVTVQLLAGATGTLSNTMRASFDSDTDISSNSVTVTVTALNPVSNPGVSQSFASEATAGASAVFIATVSNPGTVATGSLTLRSTVSASDPLVDLAAVTIVCSRSIDAICPASTVSPITVPSLPAGSSLTFTITLPVPLAARGTLTSDFSMDAVGDRDLSNNRSTVTTRVTDPRNGVYKAFAADGRAYELSIDFDTGSYTMAMAGSPVSFEPDGTGGYSAVANARFRVATDMIVGNHAFPSGVLPYVAVKSFGSSLANATGQYNMVVRDVPANNGAAVTRAAVLTIQGNQLFVCQTYDGSIGSPGAVTCPAGKQKNYLLTVANTLYTATEVVVDDTSTSDRDIFTFYLALSGASKMLFDALPPGKPDGKLRLALQDALSLAGGTFSGASTSGGWIDTMTLTSSSYSADGALDSATATLHPAERTIGIGNISVSIGVGAMLYGDRNEDPVQRIWVMQASPLAVVFGDFTATGAAAGLLQLALP